MGHTWLSQAGLRLGLGHPVPLTSWGSLCSCSLEEPHCAATLTPAPAVIRPWRVALDCPQGRGLGAGTFSTQASRPLGRCWATCTGVQGVLAGPADTWAAVPGPSSLLTSRSFPSFGSDPAASLQCVSLDLCGFWRQLPKQCFWKEMQKLVLELEARACLGWEQAPQLCAAGQTEGSASAEPRVGSVPCDGSRVPAAPLPGQGRPAFVLSMDAPPPSDQGLGLLTQQGLGLACPLPSVPPFPVPALALEFSSRGL